MKVKLKIYFYYFVLKLILFIVFLTCRWRIIGEGALKNSLKKPRPIMLCLWHEQMVCVSRFFKNTKFNFYGIISTHFDAEIYSKLLKDWKIKLIRGSSTRGWSHVIKQMIKIFKQPTSIIAITNDGPKGPPLVAKEGSVSVANKYDAQIIAVAATASKYWHLNSWDQTIIPKPFSTIYIHFSKPYHNTDDITSEKITEFINLNVDRVRSLK